MGKTKTSVVSSNLGAALESIRFEKGLNKKQFAELAQIQQSYYSNICTGKKIPNITTLYNICTNIGVSLIVVIIKATYESKDCAPEKRRLTREIIPLVNKAVELLYQTK